MRAYFDQYPKTTIASGVTLGAIGIAAIFLMLFDFKGYAERRATEALGRPVTIGALHLGVFPLTVALDDLIVADAAVGQTVPAGKAPFMKAEGVDAVIGFWRLLGGELLLKRLSVENAVARVERRPDGSLSWETNRAHAKKAEVSDASIPEIMDMRLTGVQLFYRDDATKTRLTLNMETRENPNGGEPSLLVKGNGLYAGEKSTLNATGGSILALRDTETPYPISGTLVSGPTSITVKGTVVDPAKITGLNIILSVKGQDAADLYRVAGIALPPTPAYTIDTRVDREGARWIFRNLKWQLGKSDFSGALVWDLTSEKPLLTGKLAGQVVSLKDLGGFIGAAPGEAETPAEVRREAAVRERDRRAQMPAPEEEKSVAAELVIPDRQIDSQKLNSMNAKVQLEAAKIIESGFPLDSFKADIALQDGVLALKPLVFGVSEGQISIDLTINGKDSPMRTDATAMVRNFPLQRLIGNAGGDKTSWGSIAGKIELHGTGNSLHKILATSDGNVGLLVGGGQLSLFLVELMGIDLAETLGILLSKDKPTHIRCIAADFGIEKGKMTARTAVADIVDTIFHGTGTIDLGREILDMRVHAKPKDITPMSLRSKLLLTGTFANPSFGPDLKNMILRGGVVTALGVLLTPLASLAALVDTGGGKDANCGALFDQVKSQN